VLYLGATSDFNDAEDDCPTHQNCPPGVEEDGDSAVKRQRVSAIVGIGGLVIAAGGLVWYFMSPPEGGAAQARPQPKRGRPQIGPEWAPGYAGVSVSGAF
jgi:hypothetical protein